MQSEITDIVVEIDIDCPKDQVWTMMLGQVSDWWPRDFLCFKESPFMSFEAHVGGRLYEETPNGTQILWGNVVMIVPGDIIDIVGYMTKQYGGPAVTMWRMGLKEGENGVTKFKLSNSMIGPKDDENKQNLTEGWEYLFGKFKEYCEANKL